MGEKVFYLYEAKKLSSNKKLFINFCQYKFKIINEFQWSLLQEILNKIHFNKTYQVRLNRRQSQLIFP